MMFIYILLQQPKCAEGGNILFAHFDQCEWACIVQCSLQRIPTGTDFNTPVLTKSASILILQNKIKAYQRSLYVVCIYVTCVCMCVARPDDSIQCHLSISVQGQTTQWIGHGLFDFTHSTSLCLLQLLLFAQTHSSCLRSLCTCVPACRPMCFRVCFFMCFQGDLMQLHPKKAKNDVGEARRKEDK